MAQTLKLVVSVAAVLRRVLCGLGHVGVAKSHNRSKQRRIAAQQSNIARELMLG